MADAVMGVDPVIPSSDAKGSKNDEFYKYWDRFLRVKEKTKSKAKAHSKSKEIDGRNGIAKSRTSSASSGRIPELPPTFQYGRREGPSLDRDVEGRPGHPMVRSNTEGVISCQKATTSFDEAAKSCRAKVEAIVRECRRLNQKYYDRMFDLPCEDTLVALDSSERPISVKGLQGVGSVKRVEDIYEDPEFFVDGATANDVRQGINGDCWFLAAITALSGKPDLVERLCIARDEKVGVYGFVFFRDGEWISEVVDDRLCLRQGDESKNYQTEYLLTTDGNMNALTTPLMNMSYGLQQLPKDFREGLRKGSNALYFASCKESNETWLPLMEKAYAKAHGDYQAIEGGFAGEGIEDLTGGIATYIISEDVLDKDKLWSEMLQVNDTFLFGCGSRQGRDNDPADDEGFVRGHAYTVLEAREIGKPANLLAEEQRKAAKAGRTFSEKKRNEKLRLLKLRNPWGRQEWNGAWSDGSKEWTPEVMRDLQHTFGDDGLFWIAYPDFLKFYPEIDRIRLIGPEWTVTQQWTAVKVPWTADYLETQFVVEIREEGPVVLVLSQPDDRYFQGFVGRYSYDLHFRLYKDGEETYLLRSMEQSGSSRSCTAELDLEPGTYTVMIKATATRYATDKTAEEVLKQYRELRRDKLVAVGKSFDAVHSKGRLREMEENEAKEEKVEGKEEYKEAKRVERRLHRKDRQRERQRRKRREAEERRKKGVKAKMAKEKRKLERELKKAEAENKRLLEAKTRREIKDGRKAEDDKKIGDDSKTKIELEAGEEGEKDVIKSGILMAKTDNSSTAINDSSARQDDTNITAEPPTPKKTELTINIKASDDKDNASIMTASTAGPGQPTPDSTPEPSADGKEINSPRKEAKESQQDKPVEGEAKSLSSDTPNKDIALPKDRIPTDTATTTKPLDIPDEEQESCHSSSDEDAISSASSVADSDFSWDSAMDGLGADTTNEDGDSDSDTDDMFENDPWNARCVIGLRICSLGKGVVVGVRHGGGEHEGVREHE